jgi:hypothetical protein
MAKMFYTMDEAKAALGRTEDEIRQLSKDGKLREFRDGQKLMFKADQVEGLKGALPPKDSIDINDSGAPIQLADSRSGSGIGIKDDSSPGDIGLGGSAGGVPSPRSGSRSGSGSGINIFQPDEIESADPSAATAITSSSESGSLEAVGSGSGLLDLTKESDDTSLGAVLDEINPKRDPGASRAGTAAGVTAVAPVAAASAPRAAPILVAKADPLTPFFGGLALGGALLSIFAIFVLSAAVMGGKAPGVEQLVGMGLLIILAIGAGVALVLGFIGFGLGKVLR